jgi:hypothetical protein
MVLDRLAVDLLKEVSEIRRSLPIQQAVEYNGFDRDGLIITVLDGFLQGDLTVERFEQADRELTKMAWDSSYRSVHQHLMIMAHLYKSAARDLQDAI